MHEAQWAQDLPRSIFLGRSSSVNLPCFLPPRDAFLVVLSDVPCFELAPKLLRENLTCERSFFCWGLISFSHLSIYLFIYLFVFFLSIITFISFPFYFILFYLSFSYICLFFILQTFCIIFLIWFRSRLQIQVYMIGEAAPEHQQVIQLRRSKCRCKCRKSYKCEALIHQDPRGQNEVAMVMAGVIIFGYYLCISCWFLKVYH